MDYRNTPPSSHPRIRGRCPSCGAESLFLGSEGYVTCAVIGCKDPSAAHDLLALRPAQRAALSRAPGEATEAMVEAGARAIAGALSRAMNINDARELARLCWGAMRAESEGGGAVSGTGDRMEREACAGDSASAGPGPIGAAPPSPGSDLLREVEAFLREIGGLGYIDTKDALTARELAGDLRALLPAPPAQEGGDA